MPVHLTFNDIMVMGKIPRLNLINTIAGFKSANLIGTANVAGRTNLAVFSSVVHLGSKPPYLGFILRPTTVPRHTYQNIKDSKYYTINNITANIYEQAHHTSAKYNEQISEFDTCKLTPEYHQLPHAPYVAESTIKIGMEYVEEYHIKANDTILVVGKIIEIIYPDNLTAKDGKPDIEAAGTLTISGLDGYHTTQQIARLAYQRPKKLVNNKIAKT